MEGHHASWVIRLRGTKEAICETFDPAKAAHAKAHLKPEFEIVPIIEHLQSLNGV